jgi:muramoyltetrapeptide carboxypeptidase
VVRVVAPAGPFDREPFERGLEILRSRFGLVPRLRPDITARAGYLAGNDSRRLEEWLEAASDREARALWCARGGYGSMRLLPRLELARLLLGPKWVIGFSDITAMHVALNQAGLVTLHGPHITGLYRLPVEALDHLEALLFGSTRRAGARPESTSAATTAADKPPLYDLNGTPGTEVFGAGVIRPGCSSGPLLGGSLTMLAHLCGTHWQPRLAGAVLFIEDVGEKPYRLDRYFTQLRLSGALQGVAGVAVGQFTDCGDAEFQGAEVVRELASSLEVPAIEGIAAGHEATNLALPLGSIVTVIAPGPGEAGSPRLVFDQGPLA